MNTLWSFITAWFNTPFTALFVLSLLMAVAQVFGLLGEHDSDTDADADSDIDGDADVDIHIAADHLSLFGLFAFIGVGKAPFAIVLLLLFGSMAVVGWILNGLALAWLSGYSAVVFVSVLLITLVSGALVSARLARMIGRALPPISSTASRAQDLVGKRGTVLSPYVDTRYGLIRVRDAGGTSINVFGVIAANDEPIKRNQIVVLAAYDAAKKQYWVARFRA